MSRFFANHPLNDSSIDIERALADEVDLNLLERAMRDILSGRDGLLHDLDDTDGIWIDVELVGQALMEVGDENLVEDIEFSVRDAIGETPSERALDRAHRAARLEDVAVRDTRPVTVLEDTEATRRRLNQLAIEWQAGRQMGRQVLLARASETRLRRHRVMTVSKWSRSQ